MEESHLGRVRLVPVHVQARTARQDRKLAGNGTAATGN
jgi:hypothetical protein